MKTGFIFYETGFKKQGVEQYLEGWRFYLDGKIVARSGQVFEHREYVQRSMALTASRACTAKFFNGDYGIRSTTFVVKQDRKTKRWEWKLIGANRHTICLGFKSFKTEKEAKDVVKRFKAQMQKFFKGIKCKK